MMNIYNGNIATDQNGEAVVELPEWFEALNKGFRYQLTVIGTFAQAIVAEKVKGNRFTIKTSAPNIEVSWQGNRKSARDAFCRQASHPVEEMKAELERGYYLHPDAFDQPARTQHRICPRRRVVRQLKLPRKGSKREEGIILRPMTTHGSASVSTLPSLLLSAASPTITKSLPVSGQITWTAQRRRAKGRRKEKREISFTHGRQLTG
jgi:hypothetical protein